MASHDDDAMPEETQGYKLSQPKQSLAEYQQMGKYFQSRIHLLPLPRDQKTVPTPLDVDIV
jgi:hypothetical protein